MREDYEYYKRNKWMLFTICTVVMFFICGAIFGKGDSVFNGKSKKYFYNPYLSTNLSDSLVPSNECQSLDYSELCTIHYD